MIYWANIANIQIELYIPNIILSYYPLGQLLGPRLIPLVVLQIGSFQKTETMVDAFHLTLDGESSEVHIHWLQEGLPVPRLVDDLAAHLPARSRWDVENGLSEILTNHCCYFAMMQSH